MKKSEEFSELLRRYGDMAYRMAWQITGGRQDEARDLVQDGFLKAWRYWPLQKPDHFKGWMYRLLRNLYTDALRRRARRPTFSLDGETESGRRWDESLAERAPSASETLEQREAQQDVAQALSRLDVEFRLPVVLCDMEGLSYEEIARVMLCPVGTVRSRIHRGRMQACAPRPL